MENAASLATSDSEKFRHLFDRPSNTERSSTAKNVDAPKVRAGTIDYVSAIHESFDHVTKAARATGNSTVIANAQALIMIASLQAQQGDGLRALAYMQKAAQLAIVAPNRFLTQFIGFAPTENLSTISDASELITTVPAVAAVNPIRLDDALNQAKQFVWARKRFETWRASRQELVPAGF